MLGSKPIELLTNGSKVGGMDSSRFVPCDELEASTVDASRGEPTSIRATRPHRVVTGTAFYSSVCWVFDYPFYSWVLWHLGPLWGGGVMILLSIPFDLLTYKFYDWSQEDWFAIEHVKSLKHYTGKNPFNRLIGWILRETPVVVQVPVLSLRFNSFVVSAFLREGSYTFQGLSARDWRIFWWSFLIGQVYWIIVIGSGIEVVQLIYQYLW